MLRRRRPQVLGLAALAVLLLAAACIPTGPGNELISRHQDGRLFDRASFSADLSADGRYVAFASGVETSDPRGSNQIFRKDRATGEVLLVSQADDGSPLHGRNTAVSISADGTKVAFQRSTVSAGQEVTAVWVRDIPARRTSLVSAFPNGAQANGELPDLSSDGRYVAFASWSALVPEDTNNLRDVYVKDLVTGTIRRASVAHPGSQLNDISDAPSISGDGRYVTFRTSWNLTPADRDSDHDIYVRDMVAGTTTFVSLAGFDTQAWHHVAISDDGRYVVFVSENGPGPNQVWVRDLVTGELRLISRKVGTNQPSSGDVLDVDIARDGSHVAFASTAGDLVPGDTNNRFDVFVASMLSGEIWMVSKTEDGGLANGNSIGGVVADGGTPTVFQSKATNLVPDDTNGVEDIFVNRLR